MLKSRHAVIDVGTNSVKLLVAEVTDFEVLPVFEASEQTRLGRGLYSTGRMAVESMGATAAAVHRYAGVARKMGAVRLRVIATSAAREATNAHELVQILNEASGVELEVISGDQEARWAFAGVTSQAGLGGIPILVLDVGGGSTEFVLGENQTILFQQSFPMGSVRLFETVAPGDHPGAAGWDRCRSWLWDYLGREVAPVLGPALAKLFPRRVIGVGGTTAILALIRHEQEQFDRELIESTALTKDHLRSMVQELWTLPLAERQKIPGLPPERADVILTGSAIYEAIMEYFNFEDLRISTRGLRHAAVRE